MPKSNDPTRPLLVLGVDGVLCPRRMSPDRDTWGDWVSVPGAQVTIPASPAMGAAIAQLAVETIFCSSWGTRADLVADALGWSKTPALRRELPSRWWWKLESLRAHLGARPRRPLIWVDAELSAHPEVTSWIMRSGIPALLLSPDARTGLTPADVRLMDEFCAEHLRADTDVIEDDTASGPDDVRDVSDQDQTAETELDALS